MNIVKKIKVLLIKKRFIDHNKKIFKENNVKTRNNGKILVEFNNFLSNHVGFSYLANSLKKKYKSEIFAYYGNSLLVNDLRPSLIFRIKLFIGKKIGINFFSIYKSFGTKDFYYPEPDIIHDKEKNIIHKKFLREVTDLFKLENFKIYNILVGDLIYDTYLKNLVFNEIITLDSSKGKITSDLKNSFKSTINLKDEKFILFVEEFISLFLIWDAYFKKNKIKAVIGTHFSYTLAIPLRLALNNNIESYVCTPEVLCKCKKNFFRQNSENFFLKKIFKKLNKSNKTKIIKIAKKRINQKINGTYSTDYSYVTKSPFGSVENNYYLNNNKKIKVLIATHSFGDSPHAQGNHLFTDHYQWLKYITKIASKTNYEWYVKTHPNFGSHWAPYIKHERYISKKIIKNYDNIFLLPAKVSHNQLAKEGISAVFTVHGTVGIDYPLLGIPTVNASLSNPQINYNFNLHPKNISELKNIILNLHQKIKKFKMNKKEMIEFYAIKNVFFSRNWLLQDIDKTISDIGSYHDLWKPIFYSYWVDNLSKVKDLKIKKDLHEYINSNKIFLLNNDNIGKF